MNIGIYQNRDLSFTLTVNNSFRICTTVTADPRDVTFWLDCTYRFLGPPGPLVGFSVKWRPAFGPHNSPIAVVQICIGHRCLLYQILQARGHVPDALRRFFADAHFTLLGIGIGENVQRFSTHYGVQVAATTADIRTWTADWLGRAELRQADLTALAYAVMGLVADQPDHVRMGRWDNPLLDVEQIVYASVEAFLSYEIGRIIRNTPVT